MKTDKSQAWQGWREKSCTTTGPPNQGPTMTRVPRQIKVLHPAAAEQSSSTTLPGSQDESFMRRLTPGSTNEAVQPQPWRPILPTRVIKAALLAPLVTVILLSCYVTVKIAGCTREYVNERRTRAMRQLLRNLERRQRLNAQNDAQILLAVQRLLEPPFTPGSTRNIHGPPVTPEGGPIFNSP